jgi:hypothetical protein
MKPTQVDHLEVLKLKGRLPAFSTNIKLSYLSLVLGKRASLLAQRVSGEEENFNTIDTRMAARYFLVFCNRVTEAISIIISASGQQQQH